MATMQKHKTRINRCEGDSPSQVHFGSDCVYVSYLCVLYIQCVGGKWRGLAGFGLAKHHTVS